jgi:tetratricopeptide (TPR) repeat protein
MNRKQRRIEARVGQRGRAADGPAARIARWFGAALAHQRSGRGAEAERMCREILFVDPGHAQTLHLLGLIEHQRGRSGEAIEHMRMAIVRDGRDPAFHHNLGNILRGLDRLAEAIGCYERALALAPASVDTLYNLGNTYQDLGQPERAAAYFERALRFNPNAIELHNNLGTALQDLGRLDEAIGCYRKALALRPDLVESLVGLGVVLRTQGRLEEAVAHYRRALELSPDHPEALSNLGVTLVDLGRREEAIAHHKKALALAPGRAELHYNLGSALQRQGLYAEALASYGCALALKPDHAGAHLNRALALLLTEEFDEGWQEYEWRFAVARYDRKFDQPSWSGEPLGGRSILIHAEQGFGDALQFVRYVPAVAERGGRVVLEVPEPLVRLARTVAGVSQVVARGDPLPAFDCHCPLLSLPRVFKTNLATIPSAVPYLSAPAGSAAGWAEWIPTTPGLRVGVVWAGTTVGAIDLRLLQPLWELDFVSWFSLQVGERSGDISSLAGAEVADLSPRLVDFAETAAAVCRLDLVISVDTAVAHLAGALGRPTWVLLRHPPEWRWLLEREDSPWYPTARLFRQRKEGDWPEVAREVVAALAQIAR